MTPRTSRATSGVRPTCQSSRRTARYWFTEPDSSSISAKAAAALWRTRGRQSKPSACRRRSTRPRTYTAGTATGSRWTIPAPGFEASTSRAGNTTSSERISAPSAVPRQRRQPVNATTSASGRASATA